MKRLEGKTAVVTGASSGMGRAIVDRFVREGADVVAVARRKNRLEELAESLQDAEGKIVIFPGDISAREVCEGMIDEAAGQFGHLDILVNNAGIMDDMAPIGEVTDEKYHQVLAVNVYGPMCAMRKAVQVFQKQGTGGSIVNIASVGAFKAAAGPIYCASKAALVSMTKNTAYMYRKEHIRCNAIAPGGINTEIAGSMGTPNAEGWQRLEKILGSSPAPGEAADIANAALFLASDEASYISGVVLPVDGGWSAG